MNKKKMSKEESWYHIIVCPLFLFVIFICAYPFYYLVICSFSDGRQVDLGNVILFPKGLTVQNYIHVLRVNNLLRSLGITLVRVVIGVVLRLFLTSYMAYFFTKQNMWGRKFWYRMVAITMYFSAGLIPSYLNIRMLGLNNSFWVYVIPGALSVYDMILVKTNIEALPPDLEESAFLDGAGYMTRFFRIVLPLSKPILATIALFAVVGHWNDYFTTKLYITNTKLYTLQFLLYEMLNQVRALLSMQGGEFDYGEITSMGLQMTFTVVVTLPVMLVYPFVQKYYVKGIMVGAVKG